MSYVRKLLLVFVALALLISPLTPAYSANAAGTNLVSNPSVETVGTTVSAPKDWISNKWGTNTTTFQYMNEGYTGSRSVKTTISAYTNGDAKWYFSPVAVSPNQTYTYSTSYKATITSEIVVQIKDSTGKISYQWLKTAPRSATAWAVASANITMPANAASASVFHVINKVGYLQTDDTFFGLATATTPVAPTVSITSPVANATISGTQTITATAASSGSSVAGVQFKVDGVNVGPEDTVAPYTTSWNTTTATNASHVLTAVARSNNGISTTSSSVNVTVNNTIVTPVAPTVNITAPTANTTVSGTQNITATAASSGSSVAGVQFKVDGINVGPEDVSAPYEASWDTTTTANGTHTISATARSNNGLSTTSSPISVTVNNQVTPPIDNENIVANPSVEIIDPANNLKPNNWLSNKWGANTATFNYDQTGRTGNRSITTQMTSHTDGDAKWYFEPVNVVGNKSYLFRDYYKSTVPTRIVVASIDANGAYTYIEQPSAPIATTWSQYQTTFTVPSNAVKTTVFHLIDQVGSLSIDDAYMQVATPIVPTPDSTVPNGSLEIGSASPSNWQSSSWGTNTPSFQYITNDGHTGSKSVKVSVSNYSSGDAKWFFDPIKTLTPGKQYRFNAWYKTNVIPHPVAMFIRADGTEQYFGMPAAQPNGTANWQQYSDTFSVPADAVSVSVFMYINQNGYLQTDDYSIAPYQPTGFSRPLLTMTFDDGHEDNVNTALPLLNQYGFKTTQCYATTFIEGNSQAVADILKFKNSGHEICSHTVTHPFLTTLDTANLNYELQHSKQYLESIIGQPVLNFASPYGDYNASVNNEIDNYYQSHRTVDEGYNSKDNLDIYRLRVQNVLDTTSANQIKIWIEQAKADNTWLILVYHRVASNPGPYDSYTNVFAQHLETIQTSGITVKTYQDALTEVRSQ